jgi:hypothetical protein
VLHAIGTDRLYTSCGSAAFRFHRHGPKREAPAVTPRGPPAVTPRGPPAVTRCLLCGHHQRSGSDDAATGDVKKSDVVYDLGCCDGRIVIAAAKICGARGVGTDINPGRILESKKRC